MSDDPHKWDFVPKLPTATLRRCGRVVVALASHRDATGFVEPVDPDLNPDYYEMIAQVC